MSGKPDESAKKKKNYKKLEKKFFFLATYCDLGSRSIVNAVHVGEELWTMAIMILKNFFFKSQIMHTKHQCGYRTLPCCCGSQTDMHGSSRAIKTQVHANTLIHAGIPKEFQQDPSVDEA